MKARPVLRLSPRRLKVAGAFLVALSGAGLLAQASAHAEGAPFTPEREGVHRAEERASTVRFEANHGQFDDAVRFVARDRGFGLYLTSEGATLALNPSDGAGSAVVRVRLAGARRVEPRGEREQAGRNNYFVGDDPSKWRTDVPTYGHVVYTGVLPGVDMVYYGSGTRELEYDFVLAAGVDPGSIELGYDGVESVEIAASGDALLRVAEGKALRQRRPVAYQVREDGSRVTVQAWYALRPSGKLGFAVSGHDPRLPLVIDPILTFGTFLGAGNYDELFGVATDAAGNTYVVGYTTGGLFPTSAPQQPLYAGGASDAVVSKINAAGAGFVYSTYLGGSNADQAYAVAVDAVGAAYVTGVTYSSNFPTALPFQAAHANPATADGFVTKLNANGNALQYSTYLGGASDDFPRSIGVNLGGNAFVTGVTFSAGFPAVAPYQATLSGGSDAFVTKLSPTGTTLSYSTFLGGSSTEYGNGLAVLPSGEVFVVGSTDSNNFPTATPYQAARAGGTDGFLSRLNAAGTALVSSTYLGGNFADNAFAVAQSDGAAVVVGSTTSTSFPTLAAAQPTLSSPGVTDAFVTCFTAAANGLLFSTYLGGAGADGASSVAVDGQKNVYVVGSTASANFPLLFPLANQELLGGGSWDGFFTAYRLSGEPAFSSYLGGEADDRAVGIAVQAGPDAHLAANTTSADFPAVSPLPNLGTLRGSQDGFVLRAPLLNNPSAVPSGGLPSALLLTGLLFGSGLLLVGTIRGRRVASR